LTATHLGVPIVRSLSMFVSKFWSGNQFLRVVALCGLLGLSSCCGPNSKLIPVTGRVTVEGKALAAGSVRFVPDKSKGNTFGGEPIGEINAQGEYSLQTRGKPGAPPGWYKATVSADAAATPDNTSVKPSTKINNTYRLADTTPLEVEVVAQPKPGAYDLKLGP